MQGTTEEIHCTCSFSRALDQLSQWRAYGNYAIEFNESELIKCFKKLHDCTYDIKKKNDLGFSCMTKAVDGICLDMSQNSGCIGVAGIDELIDIIKLASTFKDNGFSEEKEVRALVSVEETDEKVKFRSRGHMLVPYLEEEISLDCVSAIHVGPMNNQRLAYDSLCSLVRHVEKEHQLSTGNIEYHIEVMRSSIPLRTL